MENNKNGELDIDIMDLLYHIKAKILILLLSGIIFALAAGFVTNYFIQPIYTSTTKLYIVGKSTTLTSLADLQIGTQLTQDYMVLVKSRPVVDKVIENLGLDMTYEQMLSILSLNNPPDTRILEITANYNDPNVGKEIVDEFANVAIDQIANIMDVDKPTIVEKGYIQPYPSSPSKFKNIAIGGMLGILLAGLMIIVRYLLDDTLKSSEDVERYLALNTIGLIPMESTAVKNTKLENKNKRKYKKLIKRG